MANINEGKVPYTNEGKGRFKDSAINYGFGQMGSAHVKTNTPIIPPKGMVIVAIQFLAGNVMDALISESQGSSGRGANYIDTTTTAAQNFNGITESNTLGAATIAAGAAVAITANLAVKVGQYVVNIRAADTKDSGIILDASTATPNYCPGQTAGTYVTSVNAAGTSITLSESITMNGAETLVFIDEKNGAGGNDATGIAYPTGMIIYGRWITCTPAADADGGIIVYFGY
jgi:hypothetical protein